LEHDNKAEIIRDVVMRIAFIVNGFPYLSETFILNQITSLIELGHEVEIFAQVQPDEPAVHVDVEKYQLMKRVHYLPPLPKSRILRKLKSLLFITQQFIYNPLETLKKLAVVFRCLSFASHSLLYLLFHIPKNKFDIVHCHFGHYGFIGIALKRAGIKSRIVTEFHGQDVSIISRYKKQDRDKLFYECDLLITVCENFKDKLVQLGCDAQKIVCHYTGIYLEKFKFSVRKLPDKGPTRILTVARLTEIKGIKYSIRAIAALIKKDNNIEYVVVGSGQLKQELETLTLGMGIHNNVKFVAAASQDKVIELLDNAHIFLLSSIILSNGHEEGIPNVLKEAMACGIPVVSTFQGGTAELVVDNISGMLAPEKDVDALVKKLEYLIEHPGVWAEIGRNARAIVEENFNSVKLSVKLENIYHKLLTA
jgi:colanic acid/amylovoran biosynthesis glycosyltransferase